MKLSELDLSEHTASKLQKAAKGLSVDPDQLSILGIEGNLELAEEFRQSAEYALQKNADLYRRLS